MDRLHMDFEVLKTENDRTCHDAGKEDGEADEPFNKDRANRIFIFGSRGIS